MTAPIPDGLEPLAVWDAASPEWTRGPWRERAEWADAHIGPAIFIYRAEFYLIDAASAVVGRFIPDGDGRKWASNGEAVTETVFIPLAELPPAHLLGG